MPIRTITLLIIFMAASYTQLYAFKWPGFGDGPSKKVERLYSQAREAYGSADYSKVIDLASKAIVEYEKFANAYALRGKAQKDMGDVEKAFIDLNKAIKLDPKLGEAYFTRGQLNEIMGEMDKAKADYKKSCSAGYKGACR